MRKPGFNSFDADGPYIFWEADDQIVLTYYERNQAKNLTRLIEKTIEIGTADTIVEGIGWDKDSYHIKHKYTPNPTKVETSRKYIRYRGCSWQI